MEIMRVDSHVHTEFSCDSKAKMEDYCKKAVKNQVEILFFTDHIDFNKQDFGYGYYDVDGYFTAYEKVREKYKGRLKVMAGIEFSEPHLFTEEFRRMADYPFDYMIGSIHWTNNFFPGYKTESYSVEDYFKWYWEDVLAAVTFGEFDSLGHIDFPKRYFKHLVFDQKKIEEIFRIMVKKSMPLEINTSSLRKGLDETMPNEQWLKLYKNCGGQLITIGSDSHVVEDLSADYDYVMNQVNKIGLLPVYFDKRKIKHC